MSETPHNSYPTKREMLKPGERLMVASANVMDQRGEKIDVKATAKDVFNASWDSEELKASFRLQRQRFQDIYEPTKYYMDVYELYSDVDPKTMYRYNVTDRRVHVREEGWRQLHGKESAEAITSILEYLESGAQLTEKERDAFLGIMEFNEMHEPSRAKKVRRFAADIFKIHRKK